MALYQNSYRHVALATMFVIKSLWNKRNGRR